MSSLMNLKGHVRCQGKIVMILLLDALHTPLQLRSRQSKAQESEWVFSREMSFLITLKGHVHCQGRENSDDSAFGCAPHSTVVVKSPEQEWVFVREMSSL